MATNKPKLYWHIHHDTLLEKTSNIQERIDYIKEEKPEAEIPLRLKLMTPVLHPEKLPARFQKAWEDYTKAEEAYTKAREAYTKAEEAYDKAREAYDKVRKAYYKARNAHIKAREAYDKAREAYDKAAGILSIKSCMTKDIILIKKLNCGKEKGKEKISCC